MAVVQDSVMAGLIKQELNLAPGEQIVLLRRRPCLASINHEVTSARKDNRKDEPP